MCSVQALPYITLKCIHRNVQSEREMNYVNVRLLHSNVVQRVTGDNCIGMKNGEYVESIAL